MDTFSFDRIRPEPAPPGRHIRELFKNENTSIDLSTWPLDRSIIDRYPTMFIAAKGFDADRIKNNFRSGINRVGQGVMGSADPNDLRGRIGTFLRVPSHSFPQLSEKFLHDHSYVKDRPMFNPRDWIQLHDGFYVVGHQEIFKINPGTYQRFHFDYDMSTPHSIDYSPHSNEFVITTSGTDRITWVNKNDMTVTKTWSAIDAGYHLNIGTNGNFFVCYTDQVDSLKDSIPPGFSLRTVDRAQPSDFPTADQVSHPNSAIFHPQDSKRALITLFATKQVDEDGKRKVQKGSGGKIISLTTHNDGTITPHTLVDGLNNPHGLSYLGDNVYMVANTSSGEIHFYEEISDFKWKLMGTFDARNLPKIGVKEQNPWFQNVAITDNTITAVNSQRNSVEYYDILKKKRWEIPVFDDTIVIHKAQLVR